MESKVKLLGHPVHPMLIVVPLGAFIAAVVFDAIYLWRGAEAIATVGYYNIAVGIIGGLLAAGFGLLDWLAIPTGTRAKRIGLLHGVGMVVVVVTFGAVWVIRTSTPDLTPTAGTFAIEAGALILGAVAGWLGGELVDRLGVGVDDDAGLDASSSLSRRPARRTIVS